MPPPPPPLMDELVEEVMLRLPPASPARVVRAGLVCKRWYHLVSDPGFQRLFLEFHSRARAPPPMLGFMIYSRQATRFIPTSASGGLHPNNKAAADLGRLKACDSHHGRVLLRADGSENHVSIRIVVWNPITGEQLRLPKPPPALYGQRHQWTAAVLWAAATAAGACDCDHLDCHGGPFIVVLVCTTVSNQNFVRIYNSEAGAWGDEPTTTFGLHPGAAIDRSVRSTLVGNTLYFMLQENNYHNIGSNYPSFDEDNYQNILEYNLGTRRVSVVQLPSRARSSAIRETCFGPIELTTMDDIGRLGFARAENYSTLYLWSREVEEPAGWVLSKTIELTHLLPTRDVPWRRASGRYLVGSAEGLAR